MNRKEKFEAIRKDIRTKFPELMELTQGCIVRDTLFDRKYRIVGKTRAFSITDKPDWFEFQLTDMYFNRLYPNVKEEQIKEQFEIIGHEPMFNDVLKWLGNDYRIDGDGVIYEWSQDEYCWNRILDIEYNLSISSLNLQSEKLINYLYELIEK